jgi:hypothetical protein
LPTKIALFLLSNGDFFCENTRFAPKKQRRKKRNFFKVISLMIVVKNDLFPF